MYRIAVRELAEFTAKQGDLDLRFAPAPTGLEGMAGHATVAARRSGDYVREITLSGSYRELSVRGRADGYDSQRNQLEEIKTYRGDLDRLPANHQNLHWAQVRLYGHLLCEQRGLAQITLALVYFEIGQQRETVRTEQWNASDLRLFFEQHCERFLHWAKGELAHRALRNQSLVALGFPHAAFRKGQRALAETVFRAARQRRPLLAQAPTGIGKTIATLFPMLKAMPEQGLDKIFFLTSKTSGRALALDAATRLQEGGAQLRVLELVARDKACEHPDKACHGQSCPLAQGFYDRLPAARTQAVRLVRMDKDSVRELALEHAVCPYYLAQDLTRWADLIVGDVNYYFDSTALLYALAQENDWTFALLVDEAHNLLERARGMYSCELDQRALHVLRRDGPPALKRAFDQLNRSWNAWAKQTGAGYRIVSDVEDAFSASLQRMTSAVGEFMVEHPEHLDARLQRFYFDALHWTRLAERFGDHSLIDLMDERGSRTRATRLGIRNVLPAPFLAPRFVAARACTLFSATLSPWDFHADTLGLPATVAWYEVPAPFQPDQLEVRILTNISTRYRDRTSTLSAVSDCMAATYLRRPGNYLAFFSSFDYLDQAADALRERHPEIEMWQQSRAMREEEREAFLARFTLTGRGIGFAVLGGAFGEGIDLAGDRLIGAFIATLGLPQVNAFNDAVKARMQIRFGRGYEYAYLYPGLRKVVQAAGRVIRSPDDRGTVLLLDDRFAKPQIRKLLPGWWQLEHD